MSPLSKLALVGLCALGARAANDVQSTSFTGVASKTSTAEGHVVTAVYPDIADGDVDVSVISVGESATTYLFCNNFASDDSVSACAYNYTIVAGPSTAGLYMSIADAYLIDINCTITQSAAKADCTAHDSTDGTDTTTSTVFSNLDDFRTNITVTAGYDKIAAKTGGSPQQTGSGNDDSAAAGRMHGAAMAGFVAIFGGLLLL